MFIYNIICDFMIKFFFLIIIIKWKIFIQYKKYYIQNFKYLTYLFNKIKRSIFFKYRFI